MGGHGYAALLPHAIFIFLLDLFLPAHLIRLIFCFLMLVSGVIGAKVLLAHFFEKDDNKAWISLSGALFYLFNLVTIQNFYAPLETFIIFYGLLPWVILLFSKWLNQPNLTNIIKFFAINVLFSSIGFIPPVFVVYSLMIGFMLFFSLFQKRIKLKSALLISLILLVTNAYWLLPVGYFTLTQPDVYLNSYNNQLSTQNFNYESTDYGNLLDTMLFRSFFLDALDSKSSEESGVFFIMDSWRNLSRAPRYMIIGIIFFIVTLAGLFYSSVKKNRQLSNSFLLLPFFIFCFIALAPNVPVIEQINDLLKKIPIINQAFRASFTKFSVAFLLSYVIFFSAGIAWLLTFVQKLFKFSKYLFLGIVIFILLIYLYPIYKGNLFYNRLRLNVPNSYQEMFAYFKTQNKDDRILNLPIVWNWGWVVYDWGYTGSGFLWYGLDQPIVDRSFDVWSKYNEQFYWQFDHALLENDLVLFETVLDQYQITWLLVDDSLIIDNSKKQQYDNLEKLIAQTQAFHLEKEFDHLKLYQANQQGQLIEPINQVEKIQQLPDYKYLDFAYLTSGNYIENNLEDTIYPFAELFAKRALTSWQVQDNSLLKVLNLSTDTYQVINTNDIAQEVTFQVKLNKDRESLKILLEPVYPTIIGDQTYHRQYQELEIVIPQFINPLAKVVIGNQVFDLLDDQFNLGEVTLAARDQIVVNFFSFKEDKKISPTAQELSDSARVIWYKEGATINYQVTVLDQEIISFESSNSLIVFPTKLGDFEDSVVVDISGLVADQQRPNYCVSKEGDEQYQCYHSAPYADHKIDDNWNAFKKSVYLNQEGAYWLDLLGSEPFVDDQVVYQKYKDVSYQIYQLEETVILKEDIWDKLLDKQEVAFNSQQANIWTINLPVSDQQINFLGSEVLANCDFLARGEIYSSIINNNLLLSAKHNGNSCITIPITEKLTHKQVVIRVKGKNVQGKDLKIYFSDSSGKIGETEYPLKGKEFDSLIPLTIDPTKKLNIHFESKSFQATESESVIESISVLEILDDSFDSFKLLPVQDINKQNSLDFGEYNYKGIGDFAYTVDYQKNEAGLISLSQGFDQGWIAINWQGLTRVKVLPHLRLNGWANAWQVPAGEHKLIIIFWPQLLQFGGFALLIIGATVLIIKLRR